jgi:hypothetical protein
MVSRLKAGIVAALAGVAFALVVQLVGRMAVDLSSMQFLEYTVVSFGISGFLIGFVVGCGQARPTSDTSVQIETSHRVHRLRWRIVPVVFFAGFGLIFAAGGLSSVRYTWLDCHGDWRIFMSSLMSLYYVCMVITGVACILAAIKLMRKQWLYGWISASLGLILYAATFVIGQYMFYDGDVESDRQPEIIAEPTGPNAESVLKTAL